MPTGNRGRVDQPEPVLPAGPPPAHAHPEKTVRRAEASIRPAEYGQLMAQRHHLEEEVSTCEHRGEERRDRERVAHGRENEPAAAPTSTIFVSFTARDIGERQAQCLTRGI
jgi:hypothetical protein